jgi:CRP-like cAMP-binding protein
MKSNNDEKRLNDVETSTTNRLLLALPETDLSRLLPKMKKVSLARGEVLYEPGEHIKYAYFLNENTLASINFTMENGAGIETSLVGCEGMVSIMTFLRPDVYPAAIVVQFAGSAMRIPAETLQTEFNSGGRLQSILLRYTQAAIVQVAQTAACNRLHSVEQRLARWLLTIHDRVTGEIPITHELISLRLGAHRSSVNKATGLFRREGTIKYARGKITVLNREKLGLMACECYKSIKRQFEHIHGI